VLEGGYKLEKSIGDAEGWTVCVHVMCSDPQRLLEATLRMEVFKLLLMLPLRRSR